MLSKPNYKRMLKEKKFELGSPEFCKRTKGGGFLKSFERNSSQVEISKEVVGSPADQPNRKELTPKASGQSGFLSSLQKIETVKYTALTVPAEGVNRMDTWKKAFQNVKIAHVSKDDIIPASQDTPEQPRVGIQTENKREDKLEENAEESLPKPIEVESNKNAKYDAPIQTVPQGPIVPEYSPIPEVKSSEKPFLTGLKETMSRYKTRLERPKEQSHQEPKRGFERREESGSNRWGRPRNGSVDVQVYKPLTKLRSKERLSGSIEPVKAETMETPRQEIVLNSSRHEEHQSYERIVIRSTENLSSLIAQQTPEEKNRNSGVMDSEKPVVLATDSERPITPPKIVLKSSCELIRIEDSDFNLRRSYYPSNTQIMPQRDQKEVDKRANRSVSFNLETSDNEGQPGRRRAKGSIKPILKKKSAPRISIQRTHFEPSPGSHFAGLSQPHGLHERPIYSSGEHIRLTALKPAPHVYRNISGVGLASLFALPPNQYQYASVCHQGDAHRQQQAHESAVWRGPQTTTQPIIQAGRVYRTLTSEGQGPGQRHPPGGYHANYSSVEVQQVRRESPLQPRHPGLGECLSERLPLNASSYVPRPRMVNCLF
jgi:hypothetical protein